MDRVKETEHHRSLPTVLAVDDDARILHLVAQMLRLIDFEVVEAPGPEAAIRVFEAKRGQIDLLISDVVMPGMTGPELAGRLRASKPDLPVLFITGYCGSIDCSGNVLEKPFAMADLYHKVEQVFRSAYVSSF